MTAHNPPPRQGLKLNNRRWGWGAILLLVGLVWMAAGAFPTHASATPQAGPTAPLEQRLPPASEPNENCLMCHSDPDFKGRFQNGELISLNVNAGEYEQSVHEPAGLTCVACHTDISRYPHHIEEQVTCTHCHPEQGGESVADYATLRVELPFVDYRAMTLSINEACRSCHELEFQLAEDSVHVRVFERGNREAPVCVDCHGSHNVTHPGQPRAKISHICGTCHRAVYSTYTSSVHGQALDSESNPDVPVCTNCHGTHSIPSPHTANFRTKSPEMCGNCHADQEVMDKYGISAEVFKTYVADFHGTTLQLSEANSSSSPRQAVCFDCHGIHDIRPTDDPKTGISIKENLLETCRQCHPDVTPNFPAAWMAHRESDRQESPLVYYVETFFTILTTLVIVALVAHIILDFSRLVVKKIKSGRTSS
ncbi:MAG: cytochrome c3 family protein [Anaerolineae bacterium]